MKKVTLEMLADHLMTGDLIHKEFDFNIYNSALRLENSRIAYCGTAGCAIGELPALSDDFYFTNTGRLACNSMPVAAKHETTIGLISKYFKIPEKTARHLFVPLEQDINQFGGKKLDTDATKEEVAENIYAYLKNQRSNHDTQYNTD